MSLCSHYCECAVCKHGMKSCETCSDCLREMNMRIQQAAHEESVIRQQRKTRRPKVLEQK